MDAAELLARAQTAFNASRYTEADEMLQAALRACGNPHDPAILRSLSVVSARLGQPRQALRYALEAVQFNPQDSDAHFALALLYLLHGNYEKGFIEYEWRLFRPNCILPRYAQGTLWDGRELRDETLLLHAEQGFGDNLQFIRFLPQLRERVRHIRLACHPELVRLFSGIEGLDGLVTDGQPVPACDYHCPLLSLPRIFKTTLATVPARVPYLPMPRIPASTSPRPRIGLVWRANRSSPNAKYRSVPLEELRELANLPCEWVSLQRDPDAEEQALLRNEFRAQELGPTFRDFQETAECLQTLDVVLSVDTSIVHLAGALGRSTSVLLPRWADWRWLLDRPDSPWYPTAALYRQAIDGDWTEPVRAVRDQLSRFQQ